MEIKSTKPDVRLLYDIEKVVYDKKWLKTAKNLELYYMYRGVKNKKDLRYDITVIPGQMLGKEFSKTKGHSHNKKFGEIYTVLSGEAIYLMQRVQKNRVIDVYTVKAKKGESVVVPAYYGHITINPSKKTLKEANWVSKDCKNIYRDFEKLNGACYYYTKEGWIKNKKYVNIPSLRFEGPLKKFPKNLNFLYGNN